jgi:hypothetical protein
MTPDEPSPADRRSVLARIDKMVLPRDAVPELERLRQERAAHNSHVDEDPSCPFCMGDIT